MSELSQLLAEKALDGVRGVLREVGAVSGATLDATRGFLPLMKLLSESAPVTADELTAAIDAAFNGLYRHPLTRSTGKLTAYLRTHRLIPNEESTEGLIRFMVQQLVLRSPMPVPQALVDEFWRFYDELFSQPELKGLGEISFDMTRLVVRTYEPTLLEVINLLKGSREYNERQVREVLRRAAMVRGDLIIVRRQLRALRHIRTFFTVDPRDFSTQARVVAAMVREFGPFFIKMAQAAAANADFLPDEIVRELEVFHEDVPPMTAEEVVAAFMESYGRPPERMYLEFDPASPVRSGSIGSVFVAKRPFVEDGKEVLRPVVVKVGRHNVEREFVMGQMVLGLAIMSTHLWAPHSKLEPFLRSLSQQVNEFVAGFVDELDFENEAKNQQRFYERSQRSRVWKVPALYGHSQRVLEMEYVSDAASLNRAVQRLSPKGRRKLQARLSERLLYTLLSHVFLYNEIHGDLHPGNIMVGAGGNLHLIDWGNVVQLDGKWRVAWDYLAGAVLADTRLLTDTLVRMSVEPAHTEARRGEIEAALADTLRKRGVAPLTRRSFLVELRRGGLDGLVQRGRTVLGLMASMQQQGVVLNRDYLHLSRSLLAAAGSFGSLYESTPKRVMVRDLAVSLLRMPLMAARDALRQRFLPRREPERPRPFDPLTDAAA
jgi:ubiquinone biosynthesis protein